MFRRDGTDILGGSGWEHLADTRQPRQPGPAPATSATYPRNDRVRGTPGRGTLGHNATQRVVDNRTGTTAPAYGEREQPPQARPSAAEHGSRHTDGPAASVGTAPHISRGDTG